METELDEIKLQSPLCHLWQIFFTDFFWLDKFIKWMQILIKQLYKNSLDFHK